MKTFKEKRDRIGSLAYNLLYKQALQMSEHIADIHNTDVLMEFKKSLEWLGLDTKANYSIIEPSVRCATITLIDRLVIDKFDRAKVIEITKNFSEQDRDLPYAEYVEPYITFARYIYVFAIHKFDEFCEELQANKDSQKVAVYFEDVKIGEASEVEIDYKSEPIPMQENRITAISHQLMKESVRSMGAAVVNHYKGIAEKYGKRFPEDPRANKRSEENIKQLEQGHSSGLVISPDHYRKFAANLIYIIGEQFLDKYGIAVDPTTKRMLNFHTGEDLTDLEFYSLMVEVNADIEKNLGLRDRVQRTDLIPNPYNLVDVLSEANKNGIAVSFYKYENVVYGYNVTVSKDGKARPINMKIFSQADYSEQNVCEHIMESIKRLTRE